MFFHQLIDPDLGCASYVLGCGARALVVDPGIDSDRYLRRAAAAGAVVDTIVETHTHADHVSGRDALAAATGARIRLPWSDGDDRLAAGDAIEIGQVRVDVVAAAGHRPEHIALVISDTARSSEPWLVLTGDSLLVGDLARPDLAVDPHDGARALYETVARLCALGDGVELWPGHVGGSLCGGAGVSPKTSSTIGYERAANPLTRCTSGDELASRLLADIPPRPPTVERVVARNKVSSPPSPPPIPLSPQELRQALAQPESILVDGRAADAFEAAHLPGALNLPLTGEGLGTRAGWVIDCDAPVVVCADGEPEAAELARRLRAVAIDGVVGTAPGGAATLRSAGYDLLDEPGVAVAELARRLDEFTVVDVRDRREWDAGHVADSVHMPLHRLREAPALLPEGPLAVACAVGNRAAFATTWLRRAGRAARRVTGGGIPDLADHDVVLVGA